MNVYTTAGFAETTCCLVRTKRLLMKPNRQKSARFVLLTSRHGLSVTAQTHQAKLLKGIGKTGEPHTHAHVLEDTHTHTEARLHTEKQQHPSFG